ncbi:MAG: hypothetical protein JNJ56_07805 [Ignavibacteria bacterium]|nr:hypothetical protein [Ignavibacteria bacterium]
MNDLTQTTNGTLSTSKVKENGYETFKSTTHNSVPENETLSETIQGTVSEKEKNRETCTSENLSSENSENQSSESYKKNIEEIT